MNRGILENLGYEYVEKINTWRKTEGNSYLSDCVEVSLDASTICSAMWSEWACDEVIGLMERVKVMM